MDELYYLLELNGICIESDDQERDRALRLLLEIKRKKAYKINKKEITDLDIINEYNINGMNGIKSFFNRRICYLYSTKFVYNILFYHYKSEWNKVESIIKNKLKCLEN